MTADDARRIEERGRQLVDQRLKPLEQTIADLQHQLGALKARVDRLEQTGRAKR